MRARSISFLSLAAAAVLVLAGCSGGAEPNATPGSTAASGDLCSVATASGAATDAVTVDGDPGTISNATFESPLEVDALQSKIIHEGSGDPVADGDLITYALSAFDAETGERLADNGYGPGELLPVQITAQHPLGQLFGCAGAGSRAVAAFPASQEGSAQIYIVDLLSVVPSAAWGEPQEPVAGMPEVAVAEDGTPSVTIPEGDAPTETQLAVLKKGDGEVVQAGDGVLVQYLGVKWADGSEFDSTWSRGAPTAFQTNAVVVGFQKALEGQPVGSQVLVVVPPADGYGPTEGHNLQHDTLVFVVDILGTQRGPAVQ